ncbi:MAG: hypothetical protein JWM27_1320 [Gemmatimonadetes bacterium]|nr:hypothetical protein [Gemmatimonadota bacterium]
MSIALDGLAPLVQVFDMPTSIRFYRDLLGFEVVNTSGGDPFDWGMLRAKDVTLMLNTAYEADARPPAPDPLRAAGHGDVTLYLGCRDVDAAYAQLRAAGVEVGPPAVTQYGFRALNFRDPDGYGICLHWPVE